MKTISRPAQIKRPLKKKEKTRSQTPAKRYHSVKLYQPYTSEKSLVELVREKTVFLLRPWTCMAIEREGRDLP